MDEPTLTRPPQTQALIVEDNDLAAFCLSRMLLNLNWYADIIADPHQAIKMILSQSYSAIFLDIGLGDTLSGLDVLRIVREKEPPNHSNCIIILTARQSQETEQAALNLGVNFYLRKPMLLDTLEHLISTINTEGHLNPEC